ncbi:hypothetical protein [Mycolicibacterium lutetiense]|uniref:Outer membrane lipoprotein SlyB n=1 Tax=Mycolicibacterium lutetiense TaxID=1641992 RepID=A0ABS4ZSS7_9MYCO|nr:hypothetical protein [Mycolicibacterium lutetiense]MBP2452538.1 outer membrane lipoprotein SlyB [Mycolicibacterium lutetiense]
MWRIAVVIAASGALAMSGCANNTESGGSETQTTTAAKTDKVDAIANSVPEPIKSSGKLVIGTDPSYPPNEFGSSDLAGAEPGSGWRSP